MKPWNGNGGGGSIERGRVERGEREHKEGYFSVCFMDFSFKRSVLPELI
jgi:hypothetical protein